MERIKKLWFENGSDSKTKICILTEKGVRYERLLSDVDILKDASQEDIDDYIIGPSGYLVRWEKLGVTLFVYFFIPPQLVVNTIFAPAPYYCMPYNEVVYICTDFLLKSIGKAQQVNITALDHISHNVEKLVNEYISQDNLLVLDDTLQYKKSIRYPLTKETFSHSRFTGRYVGFYHTVLSNDERDFSEEETEGLDKLIEKIVTLVNPDLSKEDIQLGLLEGMSVAFNNEDVNLLYADTNIDLNKGVSDIHIKSYEYGVFYEKIISSLKVGKDIPQVEGMLANEGFSEAEVKELMHDVLEVLPQMMHDGKQRLKKSTLPLKIIVIIAVVVWLLYRISIKFF